MKDPGFDRQHQKKAGGGTQYFTWCFSYSTILCEYVPLTYSINQQVLLWYRIKRIWKVVMGLDTGVGLHGYAWFVKKSSHFTWNLYFSVYTLFFKKNSLWKLQYIYAMPFLLMLIILTARIHSVLFVGHDLSSQSYPILP